MELSPKQLINKFILNECTPEEVDRLITYLQNAKIDSTFPQVEEVLQLLKKRPEISKNQADAIYRRIAEKLNLEEKTRPATSKTIPKRKWIGYTAIAAIFTVVLGVSFYFAFFKSEIPSLSSSATPALEDAIQLQTEDGRVQDLSGTEQFQISAKDGEVVVEKEDNLLRYRRKATSGSGEVKYNTLTVPSGKKFEVVLEDGSYIMLNASSSLKYPVHFPENGVREVFLTGEAYFDISKDEERPFKVHTDKFEVQVLGTQFNTSSYAEETMGSVVLVEGSVNLSSTEDKEEMVRLEPGQMAELSKEKYAQFQVKEVDIENYTAWMKGGLVFRDVTFEEMLRKMGRQYNVTIINNNKELSKERFNARFDDEPLETILHYFVEVYKLNYTKKENTIIVH